tara:strand:- start:609 stop:1364 length:756 start_codon:yes stop_codon:yes gene_type:complete
MANPNSRTTLIDYCKRRLGDPVIEINVDEDQVEDRIDEAIQYYQEFHSDATKRGYLKHLMSAADITNKYITVSSNIQFISRIFRVSSSFNNSGNMFDIKYQMALNDIWDLTKFAGDMAYYEQLQQYLSTLDMKLNGMPIIDYVRRENRVYIHGSIEDQDIKQNDYIVLETYETIDANTHTSIYNDMWLKLYATALIKLQWGMNLIKFEGMQLPGGVIVNGRQIFDDAQAEIQELQEKIRLEHEMPADFFVG